MQSLRDILGREDERYNILNMGVCFLVVLAIVAIAFVIAYMEGPSRSQTEAVRGESAVVETSQ